MAFDRPTLSALVDQIEQDFISRLDLLGAVLRRAMVYILSRVLAGAAHMMHGHLDYLARQQSVLTADEENLLRWGLLYEMSPNPPDFAEATGTATGEDGNEIPEDTVLVRADGAEYLTVGDVTVASETATLSLVAVEAGEDSTLTVGTVLSFESPIDGIDATVTITASTQDGTDEEDIEDFRTRVLEHIREPAHGGNDEDYVAWAKTVTGVTRVWPVKQGLGPGTVLVRFVRDDDASIIPDSGEVAAVQAVLDEEAPSHCTPTAAAPSALELDFTIETNGDTSARDAVEAELEDLILRLAEPSGTIDIAYIRAAVANADDGFAYEVTVPAATPTVTTGQLLVLGDITWT